MVNDPSTRTTMRIAEKQLCSLVVLKESVTTVESTVIKEGTVTIQQETTTGIDNKMEGRDSSRASVTTARRLVTRRSIALRSKMI